MKDIINLENQLDKINQNFKNISFSNNAMLDAPIDKRHLEKLKKETFIALEGYKNAIITYLTD